MAKISTGTPKSSPTKSNAHSGKLKFPFQKKNYQLLLIGVGIILLGYTLMMGGGSADPNVFDPSIFSFQHITLAPIVVLVGYACIGYAIMYKPKKETEA
jgi:NADH:ubiquinone oxidoreductase subunit K